MVIYGAGNLLYLSRSGGTEIFMIKCWIFADILAIRTVTFLRAILTVSL